MIEVFGKHDVPFGFCQWAKGTRRLVMEMVFSESLCPQKYIESASPFLTQISVHLLLKIRERFWNSGGKVFHHKQRL